MLRHLISFGLRQEIAFVQPNVHLILHGLLLLLCLCRVTQIPLTSINPDIQTSARMQAVQDIYCHVKYYTAECVAGAGPLEATIANLSREIAQRTEEGHALQLQWVTLQRELLALAASNGAASEQLAKDTSTHAVMQHRLSRLEHQ